MSIAARCVLLAALFSGAFAFADDPLFPAEPSAATPLQAELRLPLSELLKLTPEQDAEFAAELAIEGQPVLAVQVSPRGKSRRAECSFPPLWLDFAKKDLDGTLLEGQNKLKLVTHCKKQFAKREYLANEMLVYRLLNSFTDASFRVRALQITYRDTGRDYTETRYGFLIEHKKRLAKRLQGELIESPGFKVAELDDHYSTLIGLFQYMVGNTDYSLRRGPGDECCHNAVPIRVGDFVMGVPYDFDATGLVNPPYYQPDPRLKLRNATQRLYRGYCAHNDKLPALVQEFLQQQDQIYTLIETFDDVPGLKRDKIKSYVARFYRTLSSPKAVNSRLLKRCR